MQKCINKVDQNLCDKLNRLLWKQRKPQWRETTHTFRKCLLSLFTGVATLQISQQVTSFHSTPYLPSLW